MRISERNEALKDKILIRLARLLIDMEMLSQGTTQKFDVIKAAEERIGPPGTFSEEETPMDEWLEILNRLAEAGEVELGKYKAAGTQKVGNLRAESKDERIQMLYQGRSDRFIAFVEDVPEGMVSRIRSRPPRTA